MPPSSLNIHTFLFAPPEDISPLSSRRVHLRRLYDILHLSIQRRDLHRARRAWAILARCREIDWKTSWLLAVGLLDCPGNRAEGNQTKIDYLRTMMLHSPENREVILRELVHLYILAKRHREALDELEFSLPSFPYRDNATLHVYAGICSVLTSQPASTSEAGVESFDGEMLDRALIFFERAKSLDPGNTAVDSLLTMETQSLLQSAGAHSQTEASDEEADSQLTAEASRVKKLRT